MTALPDHMLDSHAHVVSDDTNRYPPAPVGRALPPGVLDNPITAEKLLREMDLHGVSKAVLVQRGGVYGHDNSYVVDCAAKYPDRFVAVCSVDAGSHDGVERLRHWVRDRGAVGVRLVGPFRRQQVDGSPEYDNSWFAGPHALNVWAEAIALKVPICILFLQSMRERAVLDLFTVLERFPTATVALDHLSDIDATAGAPDYGVDAALCALLTHPAVYLKISTINLLGWLAAKLSPALATQRFVLEFGARRLLWGSDVGQSKKSYLELLQLAGSSFASLDVLERCFILGDTAKLIFFPRAAHS